jgi:LPXTG-motif cell wall-anchored protein
MKKKILPLLAVLFAFMLFVALSPVVPSMHINAATLSAQAAPQQNPNPNTQQAQPPDQSQTANPNQNPNQNPSNPPVQHRRLPKTGSELPLMGLIGLISIAGIIVVRRISRKIS